MNTTPTMTLERTDAAASAPRIETTPTTGGFQTFEPRIEVTASLGPRYDEILTPEALAFLAELHDRFADTRHELLAVRLQTRVDAGERPRPEVPARDRVRSATTRRGASPAPAPGLEDRRVEITGPTDRKMAINALNSGAKVWLADQEDATSPTWANVIEGQLTLLRLPPRHARVHEPRGQGVPGHRGRDADDRDASARLAPGREAPEVPRPRRAGRCTPRARSSTSGCTSSTTRRR